MYANMIYGSSYETLINLMSNWEGFEKYVEPIKKMKETYVEKSIKSYTPNTGHGAFNVLNHGDFHFKNMLYKMDKEGGKVEDFVMVCGFFTYF